MKFSTKATIVAALSAAFVFAGPSAYAGRTWASVQTGVLCTNNGNNNVEWAGDGVCKTNWDPIYPAGSPGAEGKPGAPGEAGPAGKGGVDGKDGADGTKGDPGAPGTVVTFRTVVADGCTVLVPQLNGQDDADNVITLCSGKNGSNGSAGKAGKDGKDGVSTSSTGARGPAGVDGKDGVTKTVYITRVVDADGNVTETTTDKLPKTGSEDAVLMSLAGLALLGTGVAAVYYCRRGR